MARSQWMTQHSTEQNWTKMNTPRLFLGFCGLMIDILCVVHSLYAIFKICSLFASVFDVFFEWAPWFSLFCSCLEHRT